MRTKMSGLQKINGCLFYHLLPFSQPRKGTMRTCRLRSWKAAERKSFRQEAEETNRLNGKIRSILSLWLHNADAPHWRRYLIHFTQDWGTGTKKERHCHLGIGSSIQKGLGEVQEPWICSHLMPASLLILPFASSSLHPSTSSEYRQNMIWAKR